MCLASNSGVFGPYVFMFNWSLFARLVAAEQFRSQDLLDLMTVNRQPSTVVPSAVSTWGIVVPGSVGHVC